MAPSTGLTHLHGLTPQVLHLDIKPSNILLDERCHARLADAGLARFVDSSMPGDGAMARAPHASTRGVRGTPAYMCPIYLGTQEPSELTDGFAFGRQ